MGQQQLLFIVLGIIIVGLAVIVGISLFHNNSLEVKRNNVINDCVNLAAMAQQHYIRPLSMGGGEYTFTGWTIPPALQLTSNGRYTSRILNPQKVEITGTGNEVVTGTDSVKVKVTVEPKTYNTQIIN
ncbi:MAG: hypothetical protein ACM3S2_08090 [Ignavibacteriales bacterium]